MLNETNTVCMPIMNATHFAIIFLDFQNIYRLDISCESSASSNSHEIEI